MIFCSVILMVLAIKLDKFKTTSWFSNKASRITFWQAMRSICMSKGRILLFAVFLFCLNPTNYLSELVFYQLFSRGSRSTHGGIVFISSPVLVAGFILTCIMLSFIYFAKSQRNLRYVIVLFVVEVVQSIAIYSVGRGEKLSISYICCIAVFIAADGMCAICKLLLVDNFLKQCPEGCEFLYINSLLSFIIMSRGLGSFLEYFERTKWNYNRTDLSGALTAVNFNWIFILGGLAIGLMNVRSKYDTKLYDEDNSKTMSSFNAQNNTARTRSLDLGLDLNNTKDTAQQE